MCCVVCTMCCVVCTLCCVYHVLCCVYHVLCCVYHVLCCLYHVLCCVYHVFCEPCVVCTMCSVYHVLCVPYVLCTSSELERNPQECETRYRESLTAVFVDGAHNHCPVSASLKPCVMCVFSVQDMNLFEQTNH
jgi:hypothetical protein